MTVRGTLQVVGKSREQEGFTMMKIYSVRWMVPVYSPVISSFGPSLQLSETEKLFASRESALMFIQELRHAAAIFGFTECHPTIVELELT